jgi:protein-S-isoprenylcysteine O-methyltransferase Ste14
MNAAPDRPGVIAPPPLIATAAVVAGLFFDRTLPMEGLSNTLSLWPRLVLGFVVAMAGGALVLAGERRFRAAGTNVQPWKPALKLATDGVYARLRNPMYVGLILLTGGIGIALASEWTLVLLVPMTLILHYGVVLREERYLERKFGEEYRRYKAKVPRWGGGW